MMSLALKKVLITGGSRGIGRALAEALVLQGAEVFVCGRSAANVAQVEQDLGVRGLVCDISSETERERLTSAVRAEFGGLDVLVNNAGMQVERDVTLGLDPAQVEGEVSLNLVAPIALTSALLPLLMSADDACIVNLTSALGLAPTPRSPVYSASKAGLIGWTHALRGSLVDSSVRVVEVVPPVVATDMTAGRHDGAMSPSDAAAAIVRGLQRRRERIVIGKARLLAAIHRLCPSLALRLMRKL